MGIAGGLPCKDRRPFHKTQHRSLLVSEGLELPSLTWFVHVRKDSQCHTAGGSLPNAGDRWERTSRYTLYRGLGIAGADNEVTTAVDDDPMARSLVHEQQLASSRYHILQSTDSWTSLCKDADRLTS